MESNGPSGEPQKQSGINATYSAGYLVQYNNEVWQARRNVTVFTPPLRIVLLGFYAECLTIWDSTGGTAYTVNIDDSRKKSMYVMREKYIGLFVIVDKTLHFLL